MTNSHAQSLAQFEKRVGVSFKDIHLLETAFTHRSYLNESKAPRGKKEKSVPQESSHRSHNERLEFLGDAVLELIVTDMLYRAYPDSSEGDLTSYRAALVNAVMLGGIAEELGMNECLLLSRGEAKDTGRARMTILANTFEAVVGALYLDQGITAAERFVQVYVMPHMEEVLKTGSWKDAKSLFQEFAQAKYGITPSYETLRAEGPDHDRHFVVSVSIGDIRLAEGQGKSKQEAEQNAASRALQESDGKESVGT